MATKTQTVVADAASAEVQELRKSWNALLAIFDGFTGGESVTDLKTAMDAAESGVNKIAIDPDVTNFPVGKLE